ESAASFWACAGQGRIILWTGLMTCWANPSAVCGAEHLTEQKRMGAVQSGTVVVEQIKAGVHCCRTAFSFSCTVVKSADWIRVYRLSCETLWNPSEAPN